MSYQALYRQWRPLDFDQVIGQNHITGPIKNQIKSNHLGHAYVFSGTRGTGKTSTAKILARAVNCLNPLEGNPCNVCEHCKSILDDQFIDVVEMDAASNNSVDDIRELREHVKFSPSKGKFKVYIIDEVHMLSQGAFNALLKTLEEPPSYVLFILATTEPQKIPATILSRCQRYEFKRVSYQDILERLQYICEQLKVTYEKEALSLIIEMSDGAVRDTLSRLDQCLSHSQNMTRETVIEILGIVDQKQLLVLTQFLAQQDARSTFLTIDHMLKQGKDLSHLLSGLIKIYRDLLVVKIAEKEYNNLISASEEYIDSLLDLALETPSAHISRALECLIELSKNIKTSQNKRIVFETTLLKIMRPTYSDDYSALLERLERLEKGGLKDYPQNNQDVSRETLKATEQRVQEEETPDLSENPVEAFTENFNQETSIEQFHDAWPQFLALIAEKKKSVEPFFEGAKPLKVEGNRCYVEIPEKNRLFVSMLNSPATSKEIEKLLSQSIGHGVSVDYSVNESSSLSNKDSDEANKALLESYFERYKDVLTIKKN